MRSLLAAVLLLAATSPARAGFAVVELFTSEGCSSCPPADRVLADLASRPGVYALEFHVDYWNSLGWRDPWSAAAYSDRQRRYADALGEEQVYTPQMIVNGTNAFVGSNRARAEAAIAGAAPARVPLTIARTGQGLRYEAAAAPAGARLCVAVVDAPRTTKVPRGENAGRTLTHARIVRGFTDLVLSRAGSLPLPAAVPPGGAVVAFVQEKGSGAILGAAETR
jgi:hypothetical protein